MPIPKLDLSSERFLNPLQLIWADHERQFIIDRELRKLAHLGDIDRITELGELLFVFFTEDLLLHHQDEEIDLFRMLRFACRPKDRIGQVLEELDRDHAAESYLMRIIVTDLKRALGGKKLQSPAFFFTNLHHFAKGQERHITWENEVVLPLASERLFPEDIEELGRNMAARRGIKCPISSAVISEKPTTLKKSLG